MVDKTGPNEQRTISREHCGFYNAVVIGAIYEFSGSGIDVRSSRSFYGAVKRCVDKYPSLSVVVRDMHTDAAFFERVARINLEEHICIVGEDDVKTLATTDSDDDDLKKIEALLPSVQDRPWPTSPPPWRVIVLPLSSPELPNSEQRRCFVAFSFSHALGDGISALAFHRTFKDGIFDQVDEDCSALEITLADYPAPFDTAKNLPISWGFLLGPFLAVLLPKFVSDLLGERATTSAVGAKTWTGTKMFFDPKSFRSCIRLIDIQHPEVENMLRVARTNGARLTATIHQSIVRALSRAIPRREAANFVSGTAVNMRRAVGVSDDEMGFFVNACFESHDRDDAWASPWNERTWASARSLTEKLAECAVTLEDQPVGLLRYIPSIRSWTAAKIGKERDSSYQVSNLGAFEAAAPCNPSRAGRCDITKMVFSRSADATSAPLEFSVVSVKGGSMVISVGWQPGAIGIPVESEPAFVEGLVAFLVEDLQNINAK
ncbi:hypothetical protein JX265_012421 [Neoarthrinium moseri]|uniref:Alcohol acetyltransferase n=1 Tax=Neoarthrinium moseri TaxID=1658444 RepID=A0A9P9WA92_9PEZI|nr:hypothetical protein JX265_012421 [Neoarthrinium moseri]